MGIGGQAHNMASHQRISLDADDLLLNGYFKTSRGRQSSPVSTPPSTSYNHLEPAVSDTRRPSRSPRPPRRDWPPNPHVEDERDSLAREFGEAHITAESLHDPPSRGVIDQLPILYNSEISASDASKHDVTSEKDDNGERRFVLIPRSDTHSPVWDEDAGLSKKPHEKDRPREPLRPERERQGHHKETRDSPPPITRRRSRQDLPTLTTNLEPEPFRRPASAYSYTPKTDDPNRITRSPSANVFLLPDVSKTKGSSKHDLNFAAHSLPRKYGGSSPRPISPNTEVKDGLGGRPTTPNTEKTSRASFNTQTRPKVDLPERFTRPQQLVDDGGSRCSEHHNPRLDRRDSPDRYYPPQLSSQSSKNGYTSSDLDGVDSSDSEKRRRQHYRHHSRHGDSLRPEDEKSRHHRTGSKSSRSSTDFGKLQKSFSTPLPSPKLAETGAFAAAGLAAGSFGNERKETYPPVRESRNTISRPVSPMFPSSYDDARDSNRPTLAAPVISRQSSPTSIDPYTTESNTSLPVPIPSSGRACNGRLSLNSQREGDRSTGTSPAGKNYWQPPHFQPPTNSPHLDAPNMGSFRRFSQDIEDGAIAPLPPCPRTTPVCGKMDWLTLPKCPDFNICPTCYQSAIEPTSFRSFFMPGPFRSANDEIVCDFGSQPWYRIAWLLLQKGRAKDLSLIYQIAEINIATSPCLGGHEAVRRWHSVLDPDTGQPVHNFDVCYACVKVIEALLPPLRGIFVLTNLDGPAGPRRFCDMRFDTTRFVHYFDALELMADRTPKSSGRYQPNTRGFVALAKKFAAIPACVRDREVFAAKWYSIAQLPELTVCHECFHEVIRPEIDRRKAIAAMFGLPKREVPVGSCGLYSERMRTVFREAVERDDYRLLARAARERREKEIEFRWDMEDAMRLSRVVREEEVEAVEREWRRWE